MCFNMSLLALKIPTKAEILAQKNCIICEETKQGESK